MSDGGRAATGEGVLYLVGTPIGNLEDITLRALRILREADIVACEDTRHTSLLLRRFGISARLASYYGAREKGGAGKLLALLRERKSIALVSDAGVPGISDPGGLIVRAAIEAGIRVVPVPGPSAALAAVSASGLETGRFVYEGFLPKKEAERRARLVGLSGEGRTIIIFESPNRIRETLADVRAAMGEREVVVARELTKVHEEFMRGTVSAVIERLEKGAVRGEIVLLIAGAAGKIDWGRVDLPRFIKGLEERLGIDRKLAVKLAAELSGIAKSVVYGIALEAKHR